MITIFNRTELYITFSMEEASRVRSALCSNKIEYSVKVSNRDFWTRGRTGSFGMDMRHNSEYKFYVKRSDQAAAIRCIHENR